MSVSLHSTCLIVKNIRYLVNRGSIFHTPSLFPPPPTNSTSHLIDTFRQNSREFYEFYHQHLNICQLIYSGFHLFMDVL